jgi:hypothetical protein
MYSCEYLLVIGYWLLAIGYWPLAVGGEVYQSADH